MCSNASSSADDDVFVSLKEADRNLITEAISNISVKKTQKLLDLLQTLGPRLTHDDRDERLASIAIVVSVLRRLPPSFLKIKEVELLLEFFVARVEDAALIGGCVFSGIHYIVHNYGESFRLSTELVYERLFKDGNVQSWTHKDRLLQLEIFEKLIPCFKSASSASGFDFVLSFIRAAGGERDPRCLLKVFQLFCVITQEFSLGPFVEDMFEVVACYYPIEFKPKESDTITREMLAVGCESCLLAHKSFHLYCYQLITEKLLDEEVEECTRLETCGFLARACDVFPPNTIYQHLDDILAAIRRIILNPATKNPEKRAPTEVEEAIKSVVRALEHDEKKGTEGLRFISETLLENCEPFVLQAEMGLMGKAMCLLKAAANCNAETLATSIVPKVFYWLGALARGTTASSANKAEIVAETVALYPEWCELAAILTKKYLVDNVTDIFGDLSAAAERCPEEAYQAEYECAAVYVDSLSEKIDLSQICSRFVKRACSDYKRSELHDSILKFIRNSAEKCFGIVKPLIEEYTDEEAKFVMAAECIHNIESLEQLAKLLMADMEKNSLTAEKTRSLLHVAERVRSDEAVLSKFVEIVVLLLGVRLEKSDGQSEEIDLLAGFIQDIGLVLSEKNRVEISDFVHRNLASTDIRSKTVRLALPFLMQTQNKEEFRSTYNAVAGEEYQAESIYVQSAYLNKFGEELAPIESTNWELDFRRTVNNARALLLAGTPSSLKENVGALNTFFSVLGPLLEIGSAVPVNISRELKLLLPIFTQALKIENFDLNTLELLLNGMSSLLKLADLMDVPNEQLSAMCNGLATVVEKQRSIKTVLTALECLDALVKRGPKDRLLPFHSHVVKSIVAATGSSKRVLRRAAAVTRNNWELIITV
ncbi:hypothetical protein QR680_005318 [Steinernema hermaphroditum]|uniref:MMS19 nucleotide excision repair protein n=1 Tax=Steinernema hermaphroditum TaxID=289476 RepID=A0AA39HRK6_9BILA|nr:hypothetical protein QR680_005318 [Steinernema hermaphroditum]